MRQTETKLNLMCQLTEKETTEYGRKAAALYSKNMHKKDDLKTIQAQYKSEIQCMEAEISLLSEAISTGRESRCVLCDIVYDSSNREKTYIRRDTLEIVKVEDMTQQECQEELELEERKNIKELKAVVAKSKSKIKKPNTNAYERENDNLSDALVSDNFSQFEDEKF